MDKRKGEFCRQVAVQQWKNNFPLWISGAFAGAILVFVAVCWAFQEKGIHAALILCCTGIALFIVGKKSVCPDKVSIEQMEVVGATPVQIQRIIGWQMAWMYLAATQYLLGIRPCWEGLVIDPCLPEGWKEIKVDRVFRGCHYHIIIKDLKKKTLIPHVDGREEYTVEI